MATNLARFLSESSRPPLMVYNRDTQKAAAFQQDVPTNSVTVVPSLETLARVCDVVRLLALLQQVRTSSEPAFPLDVLC
jgi:hypothetical protein